MTRKRLNKRLVLLLSLVGSLVMVVLAVLMLRQLQQADPAHFVAMAESAAERQEWVQAALFYHKAWERSHESKYLVARGEMALNNGDVGLALRCWREASLNEPDLIEAHRRQLDVRLELARLYRGLEDWLRTKEAAEKLLGANTGGTQAEMGFAHHAMGLALIQLASQDEAYPQAGLEHLEQAVDLAPQQVDYAIDLAQRYIQLDRFDDGESILRKWLDAHPDGGADASKVARAYGEYLATHERFDEAEPYFTQAVAFADADADAVVEARSGYAIFLTQQAVRAVRNDDQPTADAFFDRAEVLLKDAMSMNPDAFGPPIQLAILNAGRGRPVEALDVCEQRLARPFSRRGIEAARDRMSVFRLNIHASQACVALALATEDSEDRQAQLDRADQYLTDAKGESPNHPLAFVQEGLIQLARGHDRAALNALRTADERFRAVSTVDWENKKRLARLHLKLNEPGAAKELLEEVREQAQAQRAGDLGFWHLYGLSLFQTGDYDGALALADRILAADASFAPARQLKAAAIERRGDPKSASTLASSAAMQAALEAKQYTLDGDMDAAVDRLHTALAEDPTNEDLVSSLVNLLIQNDRPADAFAVVEKARSVNPESKRLQAFAVWVRPGLTPQQRDSGLLEIIEGQDDAYRRALDLVAFHLGREELPEALVALDEAQQLWIDKATPFAKAASTAHLRALLKEKLRIAGRLGDEEALTAARDAAIRYDVDGAGGQSLVGLYHVYRGEWEAAAAAFKVAIVAQPTDADALAQLGQCMLMLNELDEAQAYSDRAVRVNPRAALAHRTLGRVAQLRGDTEAYERQLTECARLIPQDPWVRAGILAQRDKKDPLSAIARREGLLAEQPDDANNLHRLAMLCESVKDRAKADTYYDQLVALRPDSKNVTFAVSRYYRRTERPEKSLTLLTRYVDSRDDPHERANAMILVASHYIDLGLIDQAETALLEAADEMDTLQVAMSLGEFYLSSGVRTGQALRWFDRAVELAEKEHSAQLSRVLAARVRCLMDRRVNRIDEARARVDELVARFPDDPGGLLLESELYERTGNIREAIRTLNRYLERVPKDAGALYRRAQYHIARGDTGSAIEDLQTIKTDSPLALELEPRLLLAQLHRQENRRDVWMRELESLVDDAPDSPIALGALVNAYITEGRLSEADQIVTAQINRASANPDAGWLRLRGRVSVALGDYDRALSDYARGAELAGYSAPAVAALLDLYIQTERYDEGLAYVETHASQLTSGPDAQSRHAVLLARTGQKEQAVDLFCKATVSAIAVSGTTVGFVVRDVLRAFEPDEAITLFEERAGAESGVPGAERILVRLYRHAGRLEEAIAIVTRLLAEGRDGNERAQLLEELGDLSNLAGAHEQARKAYEEALKLDDGNWVLLNNLAFMLADSLGEYALARPYAERAVAIADRTHTLDTLGWIYVGLGDYPRAIAELHRAIRLGPNAAETYYHLGEAFRRNQQFDEAREALQRGRELAPAGNQKELENRIAESIERVSNRDSKP